MSSNREKRKHRAIDNYHEDSVASASTTEDASSSASSRRKQKSNVNTSSFGTNNGSSSSSHSSTNGRRRRDVHRKRPRSSSNYHENEDSNSKRRRVTYHSSHSSASNSSSASSSSSPASSSSSSTSSSNSFSPNTLTARANRRRILEERASPRQDDFDTSLFYQSSPASPLQSSPSPINERDPSPVYEFSPSHDDFLVPDLNFDEDRHDNLANDANVDDGEDQDFGFGLHFGPTRTTTATRRNLNQISPVVIDLSSEDDEDEEEEHQTFSDERETMNRLNALESEERQTTNNTTNAPAAEESDFELARRLQEEENRAYQEHVNEVARRQRELRETEAARHLHVRFPQFAHRIHFPGVVLQGPNHHAGAPAIHFLPAGLARILQQRRQQQAAGGDPSLFALNFVDRDFDERDYDMLLRLDEQAPKKTAAEVEVIPTFEAKENMGTCCICLSDVEAGEKAKTLLCKHNFHADCIDKYLKEYADTCPICKASVKEQVQNLQPAEIKKSPPVTNPVPAPASNSHVRPTHLFFNHHRQAPPPQPQHVLTLPASLSDNRNSATTSIPTSIDDQLRRRRNRRRL